jgi:hypothetical protein
VAILDPKRFELAACDDSALLLQDPVASITAPADGPYIVQVRDSAYGGGATSRYRLHVGTFPRPRAVFPQEVRQAKILPCGSSAMSAV